MSNNTLNYKEVTGTFVVPYQGRQTSSGSHNESSEDEDAEEGDVFLDYRDMHAASNLVRARIPRQTRVELKDRSGRKHVCHGKFLMTQPYWEVRVRMNKTFLRSAPVYALRTDWDAIKAMNMVTIFLSDCLQKAKDATLENGAKACFESFCRLSEWQYPLTFAELGKALTQYIKEEKWKGCFLGQSAQRSFGELPLKDHSQDIRKFVLRSDLGASVLAAASLPELVKVLSALFPYTFPQIINKLNEQDMQQNEGSSDEVASDDETAGGEDPTTSRQKKELTALEKANVMAQSCPWEFCFRAIIKRKLKLFGIEASLQSYKDAGFLDVTPLTQKDAIYIYEVLKIDARKDGHMYMPFKTHRSHYYFRKLEYRIDGLERWKLALDYLDNNEVSKREDFDGDSNIFLHSNWQAEVDTAEAVRTILASHEDDPLLWDVDLQSPEFSSIRMDEDQLKATLLICSSPVVVMSGRGGCGKTTVITRLLKHLCQREWERIVEERLEKEREKLKGKATSDCCEEGVMNDEDEHSTYTMGRSNHPLRTIPIKEETPSFTAELDDRVNADLIGQNKQFLEGSLSDLSLSVDNEIQEGGGFAVQSLSPIQQISPTSGAFVTSTSKHKATPSGSRYSSADHESCEVRPSSAQKGQGQTKAQILKQELVDDLLKILSQCREREDPELEDYKSRILLTAPTGKAARLLGCKAGFPSATLHSVLTSWQVFSQNSREGEWKYANVEILVVDECSLVSVRLFANVAKTLVVHAKLRKLVLLGDVRQLPSIEPGDFLKDMFHILSSQVAATVTRPESAATSGHFSLAVELSHNHRSESELIVDNAELISGRRVPTFDNSRNFHFVKTAQSGDNERDQAVRKLLETSPDLSSHVDSQFVAFRNAHCTAINELCCRFYNNHSIKKPSRCSKGEKLDFRIGDKICLGKNNQVQSKHTIYLDQYKAEFPRLLEALSMKERRLRNMRKRKTTTTDHTSAHGIDEKEKVEEEGRGTGGADANRVLDLLDQDESTFNTTICDMKEMEKVRRDAEARKQRARQQQEQWREKERETSLKNDVASLLGKKMEKLCNGEVFFIMDEIDHFDDSDNSTRRQSNGVLHPTKYFILSDRDPEMPRVVCVPNNDLRRLCKMRHSWVRTIHTYQGSESGTVIYVLGPAIPQTWQHVYTAVTRGRKSVYVVGDWEQLEIAISRRHTPRRTRLGYRLRESLKSCSDCVKMCQQEFLMRMGQYCADENGEKNQSGGEPLSDPSLSGVFDSDDSWLIQAVSQEEKLGTDGVPIDSVDTPKCNQEEEQAHGEGSGFSKRVGDNMKSSDENISWKQEKQTKACSHSRHPFLGDDDMKFVSGDHQNISSSSGSDSEEESIFAPLSKYRQKQRAINLQHSGEDRVEEEEEVTFLTLSQCMEKDEDPASQTIQNDFNNDIEGESWSMAAASCSRPIVTEREGQTDCSALVREERGLQKEMFHSKIGECLSEAQTLNGNELVNAIGRPSSQKSSMKNGISTPCTTPSKHSTCSAPAGAERSPPFPASRTTVKRSSTDKCWTQRNGWEINTEVSPHKVQRRENVVGTPFLESFSESLDLDAETQPGGIPSRRDKGQLKSAKRKL